jgi:hypothetical protein
MQGIKQTIPISQRTLWDNNSGKNGGKGNWGTKDAPNIQERNGVKERGIRHKVNASPKVEDISSFNRKK